MVILHEAIAEIKRTLGASDVSLATSTDPGLRLRPGMTHEHGGQTKESIAVSGSETIQSVTPSDLQRQESSITTDSIDGETEEVTPVATTQKLSELASQHKRARAYLEGGRVLEAVKILENVLEERTNLLGNNHPDCLISQHELAVAYTQTGRTAEAVKLLSRVVATEEGILDESDISHLTTRHELARAYLADGQAWEAIRVLEHVVALKQISLDMSSPNLLASRMVLAEAKLRVGRVTDAISMFERVIAATTATSSEHRSIKAHSQQWLSLAYSQLNSRGLEPHGGQSSGPRSIFIGSGRVREPREDRPQKDERKSREDGPRKEERKPRLPISQREERAIKEERVPRSEKIRPIYLAGDSSEESEAGTPRNKRSQMFDSLVSGSIDSVRGPTALLFQERGGPQNPESSSGP